MPFRHQLFVALVCVTVCNPAHADRSRLDDESDVVDAGDCELEFAFNRKRALQSLPERERSLQLACGVGLQTEVAATLSRKRDDEGRADGFALEAKTVLRERRRGELGWSLVYGFERERTSSASWQTRKLVVGTELSFELTPTWFLEARLVTARDRSARHQRTQWGLGFEHTLTESVGAHAVLEGDDRGHPEWRLGLRYKIWPEHLLISLEYGAGTGPSRERSVGAAITFEF